MGDSHRIPPGDDFSTLLQARFDPTPAPEAAFRLVVEDGPDRGLAFEMNDARPTRVLIGLSPSCELRLTDREVSRRHAAMELVGSSIRLTDLQSTNGTSISGVPIVEAFLRGGETVRIGSTVMRVERAAPHAAEALPTTTGFGRLFGMSREMRRLYPLLGRLAASDVPVVIEGETGTGKELLAESLHDQGPRASGPFVVFDCTAVSSNLMEAELFGHERGAFTGAVATRKGVFEQAKGGTLFIDEIGDLDLALQPKLLRAIERREIRRVGGAESIKVDLRVLAATRRDLDREVQEGRFRDDLFHRLAVTRVELPPLQRRRGDITMLARHFWKDLGGDERAVPQDLLARWEQHDWPGNVRELRNAVARRIALGDMDDGVLASSRGARPDADIARGTDSAEANLVADVLAMNLPLAAARERVVAEFERRYVARVLEKHGGVVSQAARASGIARRHFQRVKARGTREE